MKLATNSLDQIAGLDIVSSGVLIAMFVLFLLISYRIYKTSKADADKWGSMPLELEGENVDIDIEKQTL